MAITFTDIATAVRAMGSRFDQVFAGTGWNRTIPLNTAISWNYPPFSAEDLKSEIDRTATEIESFNRRDFTKETGDFLARAKILVEGLNFSNLANDPNAVMGGTMLLLQFIRSNMPAPLPPPPPKPEVDWEQIKDTDLVPRDLKRRLRAIAAHVAEMEPKSSELGKQIEEIEAAHVAAEQLPTDMAELAAQRETMKRLSDDAQTKATQVEHANKSVMELLGGIRAEAENAKKLVAQAEEAYRITTSKGLAGAFEVRATSLNKAAWSWVTLLALALGGAFLIGYERFATLKDVLNERTPATIIWINVVMAVLGVGAPIWFAWLATRQLGQNFRLAEDYAFKSSVAKAYEGYRREAANLDPAFEQRLFSSALTRLEEAPIRLVDLDNHSSPLQEFINSQGMQKIFETIPELKDKVLALIPTKGAGVAAVVGSAAAAASALSPKADAPDDQ